MSYRIEPNAQGKNDLVIDGFEKGIAESPYLGISSMKNMNIKFLPGATYVNYKRQLNSSTAGTGTYTATTGTNTFTCASLTFLIDDAFTVSASLYGLTAGTIYFKISATQISATKGGTAFTITSSGTGIMTILTMKAPKYWTVDNRSNNYYLLDSDGRVWENSDRAISTTTTKWSLLAGNTLTANNGNGIAIYKGYLFVFRNAIIDVCGTGTSASITAANWNTAWQSSLTTAQHYALWGTDDILYFCNGSYVGAISEKVSQTFDITNSATYTFNLIALKLPPYEYNGSSIGATWLAEIRTQLLISAGKKIYPWDRTSTSFNNPIPIKEVITSMINILNNVYVLAGVKGNIYLSNGYSCEPWKKIPDSFFGVIDPQITWGDAMAHRNRLFVGAYQSNSTNGIAGIFSIDIDSGAINFETQSSIGLSGNFSVNYGAPSILIEIESATNDSYFAGWYNGTNGGMDFNDTTPWSNFEATIETDLISIGTNLQPTTLEQIEFKLDKPLISGDQIRMSYRTSLADSYTVIGTTTNSVLSDIKQTNINNAQWVQFLVELKCAVSSSSFNRLREIRLHL